ncbi:type I 3-dehydroquinate dehydratase [Fructobacillus sp. M2-14]|uniref:Type I 3-dehydroquinate dehydratase n=1 Tax=Fructobacillus broussonetiae TaxID=2713173 RepID=A0ABS5QYH5_9LACO|nr:type I 3-dehydroquinate dehydratase [Fructobacillus broussonetiae]MBS9338241.1 type I 3-dehydroquinate dehydratase [Fructobacillus broussonetiae]
MDFKTLIQEKQNINQAALAVPMALGPNDKFTPFKHALDEQNPDAVIWQADAIADDFSKEVIWDQVKQGGANAVDEGDMSAMKKASMKAELDKAYEEFIGNWPEIQKQIVQELVQNAAQTVNGRYLFLSYSNKEEGGLGEMTPADQAFFLVTALKVSNGAFSAVYLPETLDENLQEKIREAAKEAGVMVIETMTMPDLDEDTIQSTYKAFDEAGSDIVNMQVSTDVLGAAEVSDVEAYLSELQNDIPVMVTMTGELTKDQVEAWLVFPSALVTLALGENYQTPIIKSTVRELGWA